MIKFRIYICIIISLFLITACGNQVETTVNIEPVETPDSTAFYHEDTTTKEKIIEEDSISEEPDYAEEQKQRLDSLINLVSQLNAEYQQITDRQEEYIPEVPLEYFMGTAVEFGELAISRISGNFIHVHADYFEGSPVGGKHFWISGDELLAVEIVKLKELHTENGKVIEEQNAEIYYYRAEQLIQVYNNQIQKAEISDSISCSGENLKQWQLIKEKIKGLNQKKYD
jgi:hypothetical protein